jgi:isopentenyl-diphosphate Delta-isomerase
MASYPPIQVVDENDQPSGEASMHEAYEEGLIHRIVFVIVEDTDGRILLQKRGPNVATSPNKWDISVGGHVDAGETYEAAALRELREELGYDKPVELQPLTKFYQDNVLDKWRLKRFNMAFRAVVSSDEKFNPEPEEVSELKWLDVPAIKDLISHNPEQVANGLEACVKQYY